MNILAAVRALRKTLSLVSAAAKKQRWKGGVLGVSIKAACKFFDSNNACKVIFLTTGAPGASFRRLLISTSSIQTATVVLNVQSNRL